MLPFVTRNDGMSCQQFTVSYVEVSKGRLTFGYRNPVSPPECRSPVQRGAIKSRAAKESTWGITQTPSRQQCPFGRCSARVKTQEFGPRRRIPYRRIVGYRGLFHFKMSDGRGAQ